jgi:hypothetical protein
VLANGTVVTEWQPVLDYPGPPDTSSAGRSARCIPLVTFEGIFVSVSRCVFVLYHTTERANYTRIRHIPRQQVQPVDCGGTTSAYERHQRCKNAALANAHTTAPMHEHKNIAIHKRIRQRSWPTAVRQYASTPVRQLYILQEISNHSSPYFSSVQ